MTNISQLVLGFVALSNVKFGQVICNILKFASLFGQVYYGWSIIDIQSKDICVTVVLR